MDDVMLTTIDNPYDPFTQWDDWFNYDTVCGYNTCDYLARIARTSDALSDNDNDEAIDEAINEIVSENVLGIYCKAYKA